METEKVAWRDNRRRVVAMEEERKGTETGRGTSRVRVRGRGSGRRWIKWVGN